MDGCIKVLKELLMLKKILAIITLCFSLTSYAAIEVNTATEAELDSINGIGPAMSGKILKERKNGDFKDWNQLMQRIKGIRAKNAAKFSMQGMTVNGQAFQNPTAISTSSSDKK